MEPAQIETVPTRGGDYVVTRRGMGQPVLLHPSLGRPGSDLDVLAEHLARSGHHTISVDPPGISTAVQIWEGRDLNDLATDLWQVVDHLDLGPVALIGHAFGNRLVRAASTARPDQVWALVLLACGGEVGPTDAVWHALASCFDTTLPEDEHLRAVSTAFFAPANDASIWRDGWFPDLAAAQAAATTATNHHQIALGGTAPGLVVQGLDDALAPPQNAWNLVARRPDTRVVGLPDCGHAMLPEQPSAICDAVTSFFTEVERTT